MTQISLDDLALILLAVSVSKSTNAPRVSKNPMSNIEGRVAQTVSDWVTYRNDRVVRLKHGLQRDEPRDATPKQAFC